MEEWHRYNLPTFTERMKSRVAEPLRGRPPNLASEGRYTRYMAEISRHTREDSFAADVGSVRPTEPNGRRRRLGLVDLDTGEIHAL